MREREQEKEKEKESKGETLSLSLFSLSRAVALTHFLSLSPKILHFLRSGIAGSRNFCYPECLRYLTVPSLAVAPSFDILVTSAGVNYPTVDTGDPALWLLYTLLIAPWARAPWEHHLLSNICRLSIFSSQKSPSACARSLSPSPG